MEDTIDKILSFTFCGAYLIIFAILLGIATGIGYLVFMWISG